MRSGHYTATTLNLLKRVDRFNDLHRRSTLLFNIRQRLSTPAF